MIPIKTEGELRKMRDACRIAATVLERLCRQVAPGINTYDLDQEGKQLIEGFGASSACYNYRVGNRRFPSYTCLSINEEVVHGIGKLTRVLQPGDSITVDICVFYDGFVGDNARTIAVGPVDPKVRELLQTTEQAMYAGIDVARSGRRVHDISHTIQRFVEQRGMSVVRDFVGHGVGRSMHEEPQIPNFGQKNTGKRIRPGMTLAIEPMVNLGRAEVDVLADGWTAVTRDRQPSAHFEQTVLVTEGEPEILTVAEN